MPICAMSTLCCDETHFTPPFSSGHTIAVCGSMYMWYWLGKVYLAFVETLGALAMASTMSTSLERTMMPAPPQSSLGSLIGNIGEMKWNDPDAMAASMLSTAGAAAAPYLISTAFAARRAELCDSASTQPTSWPACCTSFSANSGGSTNDRAGFGNVKQPRLAPGTSAAVSSLTKPGMASALLVSMPSMVPTARVDSSGAANRAPMWLGSSSE
mmetsp:Transcript_25966/g.76961  ORF Transcript_25966/g.76961 Transcript_25966/m.76961 type:complete len:213 (-) Transcript_25966:173-811(-)